MVLFTKLKDSRLIFLQIYACHTLHLTDIKSVCSENVQKSFFQNRIIYLFSASDPRGNISEQKDQRTLFTIHFTDFLARSTLYALIICLRCGSHYNPIIIALCLSF